MMPTNPLDPHAFLPSSNPQPRPAPVGARLVEVTEGPPERLTLTVSPRGRVYLSRQLAAYLNLRHGQPIELLPPTQRKAGHWHLLVPADPQTPLYKLILYIGKSYKPQFDCRMVLSPTRFRRRHTRKGDGRGGGWNEQLPLLTLELLPTAPGSAGFLPLRPLYPDVPNPATQ